MAFSPEKRKGESVTMTIKERLIAGLQASGYERFHERDTSKLVAFRKIGEQGRFAYVGMNGALRVGRTASVSYSMQGTPAYANLLKVGDTRLSAEKPQSAADRYA